MGMVGSYYCYDIPSALNKEMSAYLNLTSVQLNLFYTVGHLHSAYFKLYVCVCVMAVNYVIGILCAQHGLAIVWRLAHRSHRLQSLLAFVCVFGVFGSTSLFSRCLYEELCSGNYRSNRVWFGW